MLLPEWVTKPQPERTYTGCISRSQATWEDDAVIVGHPSGHVFGGKILKPHFVVLREGGQYQFVSNDEWERMKPLVPIYGERIGDTMVMWDRIVRNGVGGVRVHDVPQASLSGYRWPEWFDEEGEITEEQWGALPSGAKLNIPCKVYFCGGRQSGKTVNKLAEIDAKYIALDYGVNDRTVGAVWSSDKDGNIAVSEILTEDFWVKPEAPAPAKKTEKPVDFFPSKVGRIAKMPRYPGTWG